MAEEVRTETRPWEPIRQLVIPRFRDVGAIFDEQAQSLRAQGLYSDAPYNVYGGPFYAPFAPEQELAFAMGTERALGGGGPFQPSIEEAYTQALTGPGPSFTPYSGAGLPVSYNPYQQADPLVQYGTAATAAQQALQPQLQGLTESVIATVAPQVQSQFAGSGRAGSSAERALMARETARALGPAVLQATQAGTGQALGMQQAAQNQVMRVLEANAARQQQAGLAGAQMGEQSRQFGANLGLSADQQRLAALGMAPEMTQLGNVDINMLQNIGAQRQAQQQRAITGEQQRLDYLNMLPYAPFTGMTGAISPYLATGQGSVRTAPDSGGGGFAGMLGGALTGAGAIGAIPGVGLPGALIGGALGGLGGLFA